MAVAMVVASRCSGVTGPRRNAPMRAAMVPATMTIAMAGDRASATTAASPPAVPINVNVRIPAVRVPSASARCFQPRSTPMIRPQASAASKGSV